MTLFRAREKLRSDLLLRMNATALMKQLLCRRDISLHYMYRTPSSKIDRGDAENAAYRDAPGLGRLAKVMVADAITILILFDGPANRSAAERAR